MLLLGMLVSARGYLKQREISDNLVGITLFEVLIEDYPKELKTIGITKMDLEVHKEMRLRQASIKVDKKVFSSWARVYKLALTT